MLKRIIIVLVIVSSGLVSTLAQEVDKRTQMHFGAKVGFNASNIYKTSEVNFETHSLIGFVAGAFLQVPILPYLGIQPELLFSQRGYNATSKNFDNGYNIDRTLSYLDVPIMVSFSPTKCITLLAGPQLSIYLDQKDAYVDNSVTATPIELVNENQKGNLSFLTGIDFNFSYYVLSGRMGWDLSKSDYNDTNNSPQYKNLWIQATFGIRI